MNNTNKEQFEAVAEIIINQEIFAKVDTLVNNAHAAFYDGVDVLEIDEHDFLNLYERVEVCGSCTKCAMAEEIEDLKVEQEEAEENGDEERVAELEDSIMDLECQLEQIADALECGDIEEACNDASRHESLEFYMVSQELFFNLQELGENVAKFCSGYLWGRTCSGQLIIADGTMQKVAALRDKR